MRRIRVQFFALVAASSLLLDLSACSSAPSERVNRTLSFSNEVANLLKNETLDEVAARFVYPPMAEALLREDQSGVRNTLSILLSEFGPIESIALANHQPSFFEVGVYGGSTEQLTSSLEKIEHVVYLYDSNFEKFGPGLVKIVVSKGNNFGVRLITFGLEAKLEHSKERVLQAAMQMEEFKDASANVQSKSNRFSIM